MGRLVVSGVWSLGFRMDGAQAVTSSTTVLDPSSTIQAAGLKDGDEVGVITAPKCLGYVQTSFVGGFVAFVVGFHKVLVTSARDGSLPFELAAFVKQCVVSGVAQLPKSGFSHCQKHCTAAIVTSMFIIIVAAIVIPLYHRHPS